jgi:hypothetical protein
MATSLGGLNKTGFMQARYGRSVSPPRGFVHRAAFGYAQSALETKPFCLHYAGALRCSTIVTTLIGAAGKMTAPARRYCRRLSAPSSGSKTITIIIACRDETAALLARHRPNTSIRRRTEIGDRPFVLTFFGSWC